MLSWEAGVTAVLTLSDHRRKENDVGLFAKVVGGGQKPNVACSVNIVCWVKNKSLRKKFFYDL